MRLATVFRFRQADGCPLVFRFPMGFRRSFELVTCHTLDGQLPNAFLILHFHLHDGSRLPSDHVDDLLVILSLHGGSINALDFIAMPKACLVSRSLRMDHSHIQLCRLADMLSSDMK